MNGTAAFTKSKGSSTSLPKQASSVLQNHVHTLYCPHLSSAWGFSWHIFAVHMGWLTSGRAFVTPLNPQLPSIHHNAFVLSRDQGLQVLHRNAAHLNAIHAQTEDVVTEEPRFATFTLDEDEQIGGRSWTGLQNAVIPADPTRAVYWRPLQGDDEEPDARGDGNSPCKKKNP